MDREAYVANIPSRFNLSKMNDKNLEMMGMQVWVHQNTLLNLATLKSFNIAKDQAPNRGVTYDIVWNCQRAAIIRMSASMAFCNRIKTVSCVCFAESVALV